LCDSLEKDAPKGAGLQAGLHASSNMVFPGNGKSSCQTRQIVAILEKFHARGWTAPIRPTYCPDTKISIKDKRIERQAFDGIKATVSAVLSGVLPPLLYVHLHFAPGIRALGSRIW